MVKITCSCGAYFQTDTMLQPSNGVTIGNFINSFIKEHHGCLVAAQNVKLSTLAVPQPPAVFSERSIDETDE